MKKDWTYKKLGEVGEVIGGTTPSTSNPAFWNGDLCWISPAELHGEHYLYDSVKKITREAVKAKSLKLLPVGTVILSSRAPIGKLAINKVPMYCNQGFKCVVCGKELYNEYLYWWFFFKKDYLNSLGTGATFPEISKSVVENIEIPLPPLSEQSRIVSRLDAAFGEIEGLKAKAEAQLREARTLFQAALTQEMKPKQGWEEKPLKELADYSIGLTYKPSDVSENGTIVLRSSNIQDDKLDLADIVRVSCPIKDYLYVEKGDILMCSRNGSARLVGKVAVIPETGEKMTYGTFMMIIRSKYNPFLFYFFKSDDFREQIKHGEANMINQITRYMLDDVVLNVPPLSAQQQIVSRLDALSEKVRELEETQKKVIAECDALKQALLRDVFE